MAKIHVLPENLSNQIAAGEVVERPASVIKELVENSLDAGARRIGIETELGGRRLMKVSDDGEGMDKEDAGLAFERYATSKISRQEDLGNIATLGFRGEALASIASVARVEILTKTFDGTAGTRLSIEGGRIIDKKEAARPTGTTVTVRDLFFNTPARRKFMRSQATENFHITSIVTHYALANPGTAFTLKSNGREIIRATPANDLRERAFQLFGSGILESLLPVTGGREFIANVSGYVSAPRERRTTRDSQYFFINGRFVKDKIISSGLQEGYRSVLPHGVYPMAFLFLEIPYEEIDVNVHPAKTEVRFRRALAVKDVVAEAVRESLRNAGVALRTNAAAAVTGEDAGTERESKFEGTEGTPQTGSPPLSGEEGLPQSDVEIPDSRQNEILFRIPAESHDFEEEAGARITDPASRSEIPASDITGIDEPIGDRGKERNAYDSSDEPYWQEGGAMPAFDSAASVPIPVEVGDVNAAKIEPIGQLHDSFIIAADKEGLLLIDQHVAHERILFDKYRHREENRVLESQNLLIPETIDLTPAQLVVFEEIKGELEKAGFGLMRLSGRTVAVKSMPADLPASEAGNLLGELLETFEKEKRGGAGASLRDAIAASMACKAAVKINMKLTKEKMSWMVDRLMKTSSPTTCPHGRPVILRLTMKDIERKFHRS